MVRANIKFHNCCVADILFIIKKLNDAEIEKEKRVASIRQPYATVMHG
ncbi:hypothetical protein [Paraclostridium bifermentans]|nr:hypothetical protein [Paraclostridium bifermentans]